MSEIAGYPDGTEATDGPYRSMHAACACCGHLGYRFPVGLCGTCVMGDHGECLPGHRRIRRTGWV